MRQQMMIAAGLGVLGLLLACIGYTPATPVAPMDLEKGRAIYQRHCADCHGTEGKGDGQQATSLSPRPGNLISAQTSAKSDQELLKTIAKGRHRTALAYFARSLEQRGPNASAWLGAALAHHAMDEPEDAVKAVLEALALEPDLDAARALIVELDSFAGIGV